MPYHIYLWQQFHNMVDDSLVYVFVWLVVFDVLTGYMKAWVATSTGKKTNSTKGLFGLVKHLLVLVIILTGYPLICSIGYPLPAQVMVVALIYNYAVSITENLGQSGVPIPAWLKQHLTKLQDDYNSEDFDPVSGHKKNKD